MMNAAGIGSGLDVNSIVSQLMQVERQPLTAMQKKETELQSQISAYGKLRSAVDTFSTAMDKLSSTSKFELYSANVSTGSVLSASTTTGAKIGSYNVVVNNLAQNHKMASAQVASTTTFGGADPADALNFTVGSNSFSVNISNGGAGMTLSQVRDAINSASGNTSVAATVVTGNNGVQQLVLNSKNSGAANSIQMTYGGTVTSATLGFATANVDGAGNTIANVSQLDASFTVDGMTVTRATNSITDVIGGVTLNLTAAGSTTVNVTRDSSAVTTAVKGMVDSYNSLVKTISSLKNSSLQGDSALNSITSGLRNVLNSATASGTFKTLGEVGLLTNRYDGTLEVNSTTLNNAMNTDFAGVASLFGNSTDGVALRLKTATSAMLQSGTGLLATRTDGLNSRVKDLKKQQDNFQYRLDTIEKGYRKQFTSLDTFVSKMNSTSSYLQQQLASLVIR